MVYATWRRHEMAAYCERIGFWDALIIVAAKSGATRLLSEDLNQGQKLAGLRMENPFEAVR